MLKRAAICTAAILGVASFATLATQQKATAEKPAEVSVVSSVPLTINSLPAVTLSANNGPLNVRNLDEPGRAPYQLEVACGDSTTGTATTCRASGAAVPAGKRVVITNANIVVETQAAGSPNEVWLQCGTSYGRGSTPVTYLWPTPTLAGRFQQNATVLQYCDAGLPPTFYVSAINSSRLELVGKISGYLVDLN